MVNNFSHVSLPVKIKKTVAFTLPGILEFSSLKAAFPVVDSLFCLILIM